MILITGAKGQLGTDFKKIFDSIGEPYIATDVEDLDITHKKDVEQFIAKNKVQLIINCAAYNNVDKAEIEQDLCYSLNCHAPHNMAMAAKSAGAVFVTYSTDFVFDGTKGQPYTEDDMPNPLSVYAKSKYEGEQLVLHAYDRVFVIRTSWLFGKANKNFNTQVLDWSQKNTTLRIVDDQISVPTYSYDLARYSWMLILTQNFGLYHIVNAGQASKYDQAKYLLDRIGWNGTVVRAKSSEFNTPAQRPAYSKLDTSKFERVCNTTIPHWQDAIDRWLKEMNLL